MARTNYSYEKRQRELKKLKKRKEKQMKKDNRNILPSEETLSEETPGEETVKDSEQDAPADDNPDQTPSL